MSTAPCGQRVVDDVMSYYTDNYTDEWMLYKGRKIAILKTLSNRVTAAIHLAFSLYFNPPTVAGSMMLHHFSDE